MYQKWNDLSKCDEKGRPVDADVFVAEYIDKYFNPPTKK